ncbi:unnamed protein product [Ilex paraguariensis]|uniref:Protein TIFY n=1 Tax=Ilex paraguariensis TaxID=185542 RepID=A0ABC8RYQ1_9AQUA
MSNPNAYWDGRKSGKAPEKSNFTQTCNLLSQYFKEKRSLGDLNLGFTANLEATGKSGDTSTSTATTTSTTINLLTKMEKSGQASQHVMKFMDSLPQYARVGSSSTTDTTATATATATNDPISSKPEKKEHISAQMTMFYAGQVLVFNDFPADKAREVMLLADQLGSSNSPNPIPTTGFVSTSTCNSNKFKSDQSLPPSALNTCSTPAQQVRHQPHPEATSSGNFTSLFLLSWL